ncbi:unnamed protein product [Porites lobata]|uniref:Uncharacterized protein n=1 Tax=Porites lobata TaxID=104759 RepID=A0ABN8QWW7_9CNID|nr:unnamed protein product [Porites lobata]
MKNETTNERLTALESRISIQDTQVIKIRTNIVQCFIVIPVEMNSPLALEESGESRTKAKPRNRRQVLNATSAGISIHDVRKEISKQFEQLMPTKYCKSRRRYVL